MNRVIVALGILVVLAGPAQGEPLGEQYANYNARYFGNRLPKDAVVVYAPVGSEGEMGDVQKCGAQMCIRIDPNYNRAPRVTAMALLHEMCHLDTVGVELDPHGLKWQACMLRLASAGTFEKLW